MPFITWTPRAVASNALIRQLRLWRAVEAQHIASTRRLTDSLAEQIMLEDVLERSKPALPTGTAKLHYLLATPFRYPSPLGSRFRASIDPSVWYGAKEVRTACAELGYWRWRFLLDSKGLEGLGPSAQTVFQTGVRGKIVDLSLPPFVKQARYWQDPSDYSATQAFGRVAREADIELIRYASVRDPLHAACAAVLTPRAFHPKKPLVQQTWFLTISKTCVSWKLDSVLKNDAYDFDMSVWRNQVEAHGPIAKSRLTSTLP